MLTQLYTPQIRHIAKLPRRPQVTAEGNERESIDDALHAEKTQRPEPDSSEQQGRQQRGGTLASLEEQQARGSISITTILSDFKKTLESINASKEIKDEVLPYLQVVAHQSKQRNPAVSLIKQNLTIAASSIDQFISTSLGQPSHVVKEWVDALLLQPINFNYDSRQARPSNINTPNEAESNRKELSPEEITTLEGVLNTAQEALQQKDNETAKANFLTALEQLGDAENPILQARTHYGLGRVAQTESEAPKALGYYQQSLLDLAPLEPHPMQGRIYGLLSGLQRELGETDASYSSLEKARTIYKHLNQPAMEGKILNRLGKLYLDDKNYPVAESTLNEALESSSSTTNTLETLEQLGRGYREQSKTKDAFQAYRQAIELTQETNDIDSFKRVAQQVASLYLENGKPDKAYALLQRVLGSVS